MSDKPEGSSGRVYLGRAKYEPGSRKQGKPYGAERPKKHQKKSGPGGKKPYTKAKSQGDEERLPGVSKIKAAIRQTTRLLAKEHLDPALRVQTERRLTSLKADVAKVEQSRIEQKNGKKYHMVKFFERQKIMRIIKRLKRQLKDLDREGAQADELGSIPAASESEKKDKKSKKKGKDATSKQGDGRAALEQELEDARCMLNYVVRYPNTQKYIALFPARKQSDEDEGEDHQLVLPPLLSPEVLAQTPSADDKTSAHRQKTLLAIRERMQKAKEEGVDEFDGVHIRPEEAERKKDKLSKKLEIAGSGGQAVSEDAPTANKAKVALEEEDDFFGGDD